MAKNQFLGISDFLLEKNIAAAKKDEADKLELMKNEIKNQKIDTGRDSDGRNAMGIIAAHSESEDYLRLLLAEKQYRQRSGNYDPTEPKEPIKTQSIKQKTPINPQEKISNPGLPRHPNPQRRQAPTQYVPPPKDRVDDPDNAIGDGHVMHFDLKGRPRSGNGNKSG